MSDRPNYTMQFTRNYATVAVVAAVIAYVLLQVLGLSMENVILRGALIGGGVGAVMVPIQNTCRSFLGQEGRVMTGREGWKYAAIWAGIALVIHIVISAILFAIGWQMPGILPQEQGTLVGFILALVLILQIPIFRLFQWAGFKGVLKQQERAGNS